MKFKCKECGAETVATDEFRFTSGCYGSKAFWEVKLNCGCWEKAEIPGDSYPPFLKMKGVGNGR